MNLRRRRTTSFALQSNLPHSESEGGREGEDEEEEEKVVEEEEEEVEEEVEGRCQAAALPLSCHFLSC